MTGIHAGLLLPQSTLTTPWFQLLSTFVAFNTIIYLGLTLSKLIPWPRQFHPSQVRAILAPMNKDQEAAMAALPVPERPESDDPFEELRSSIARRDVPQAFALVGGLVIVLSVASFLTFSDRTTAEPVFELFLGLALLIAAQVLGRRRFRSATMTWTWVIAMVIIVGVMLGEALVNDSQLPLAYALIVMTGYAPVALSWRPTFISGALMLVGVSVISLRVRGTEDGRIIAASTAAVLVSFVLLQLRLSAIDDIAGEQTRSTALATTDFLTGTLTRQGLITLLPGIAATAERTGQEVCVMQFDIDDLARANREYGPQYGDDILHAVGAAITTTVRRGDLVARWGGDEFLVAGLGGKPSADALAARIQEAVRISGVNLGKWPTTVTVSTAAGSPAETTFDALVAEATD
jgi:diguanylate cyclase (GGDEF)-like protein